MASSSEPKRTYDVFLSSSRYDEIEIPGFSSRLAAALDGARISTFGSSKELGKEEHMPPALAKVIEESHIAIIIFRGDFASSICCLEEVVKIMECKEQRGLRVFPVFCLMDPSEVMSLYMEAMHRHESKFRKDSLEVSRWKEALSDARRLSGWHFRPSDDESELLQNIVNEISRCLNQTPLRVARHLVGIDSRVDKLKSMLNLESDDDAVMVGVWGQPGIGKTALARALYCAIFRQFEGSCFLENVREASKDSKDLVLLQEKLLSEVLSLQRRSEVSSPDRGINLIRQRLNHKKVLLVLDDVDDLRQLNALAGEGMWFGNGSRIIVTTRDERLLTRHGIAQDHVYEVKALSDTEARSLLEYHVFNRTRQELDVGKDLMGYVMNYARGIPLALEVLAFLLRSKRSANKRESTLEELFKSPWTTTTVKDVLMLSYGKLREEDKEIFLHIACFFNGWNSKYVKKILQCCFPPEVQLQTLIDKGLRVLIDMALISIDECGIIRVLESAQSMGMDIVKHECRDDPERRSRLWLYDDVVRVLSKDMEDCAVKAIVLEPPEPTKTHIGSDAFTKMSSLKLLIVRNVHNSFQGPMCLPNGLRLFEWAGWAPSIPELSSYPKELVSDRKKKRKELMGLDTITVVPKQSQTSVATVEHVIGIDDRVKDVIKLLQVEDDKVRVRIIGIHGTSGMGKTTIAKAAYNRLSSYFDSCSFLAEIGETAKNGGGIRFMQTKLISDILKRDDVDVASFEGGIMFFRDVFRCIKVLIVLDDVEDESHLHDLLGDQLDWFGPGSWIIVTSEDGEIFKKYVSRGLAHTLEVKGMDNDQALELLWKHASAIDSSIRDYLQFKKHIIEATGQVPFVSEVIGTFLRGKQILDWWKIEDSIKPRNSLGRSLKDCREILEICYEALHDKQKEMFWDIAWFANGVDSRVALYMWPDQDLSSSPPVLMPLAKIGGDNMLWMHRMLKDLSRTMHQEGANDPGSRSRRYMRVAYLEEFSKKEGMEEVEALCFDLKTLDTPTFEETVFKSMPNIRFLKLDRASMTGNFANVFPKLRWLRWQGCPREFKAAEFSLTELVILDLSWSKVVDDWGGWTLMKMEQLKVLNLTGCADLLISPKFSGFLNLEILILERCSRLVYLDPSIGDLKKLLCLNLKSCTELNRLPAELGGLEALKEILIDGTSVEEIPLKGYSKELETLSASNCLSLNLLDGVGELVKLRRLSLRNCHWIQELPVSIGQSPLEELDISGTGILELPDSFRNLQRLSVLKMDSCFISEFPSFLWLLQSLEEIHASLCRNLEGGIPGDIFRLKNLRILRLRNSAISSLPRQIEFLSKLETLDVLHCDMLHELPKLPSSLVIVHLSPKLKEKVSHRFGRCCFITV
ncbi:disease resistance protein RPV1-like isoform X2 [Rhodamnia argentea]|uniref:Disease resistance protein RPV1-like isoform X2 n=1 Tax=Rhodamnia argentea TaxID=178133 RepID=A0A8B8R1F7_9MYRT|nr:disease resistance protein RPV1-like isoform X2 [Rhodamnia argentea]